MKQPHEKEGIIFISIAIFLIIATFLCSDGYIPKFNILWNLMQDYSAGLYSSSGMTIYEGYPFIDSGSPVLPDSFHLIIYTRHVLLLLFGTLIYGVGRYFNFFGSVTAWVKSIKSQNHSK